MNPKIIDMLDFKKLDVLLESFNKLTSFKTAILDVDGNILSKSGWRQICTEFHRVHPETASQCIISDTELGGKLDEGKKYNFYKCLNGMVDVAVPIIINDEHVANIFSGQFFFEKPNLDFFLKQAEKYDFDNKTYMEALDKVPIVSEEEIMTAMEFLLNMTNLISEMTQQRIKQIELNKNLIKSEERWKFAIEENGDGLFDWNVETNEIFYSKQWKAMLGFEEYEIENNFDEWEKRLHPDDKAQAHVDVQNHLNGETDIYSNKHRLLCKDGSYKWILAKGKITSRTENNKPLRFIGTHRDITEQRNVEESLYKSREKYRLIDNATMDFIYSYDLKDRFTHVNPSLLNFFGLPIEDVLGKDHRELNYPENICKEWDVLHQKVYKTNSTVITETSSPDRRGEIRHYEVILNPLHDNNDTILGIAGVTRDITERKQAEDKINDLNKLLNQTGEMAKVGGWELDLQSSTFYFTDEMYNIYELPPGLVLNLEEGLNLYPPETQLIFQEALSDSKKRSVPFDIETEIITQNGNKKWVRAQWQTEHLNGSAVRLIGTLQDITQRKLAEKSLVESEEKFRTFIQKAPIPLCHVDNSTGIVKYLNNRFVETLGYTLADVPSLKEWWSLAYPNEEYRKWVIENWEKAIDYGIKNNTDIKSETYSVKCKNKEVRQILISGIILGDNFLLSFIDLTDQKRIVSELKKHQDNLEELIKERTSELEKTNEELENFNNLFIGREFRIKELKDKIEDLENKLKKSN